MKIHFIGDIHGDWGTLNLILSRYRDNRIIQVGDMGLGFNLPIWNRKLGKFEIEEDPPFDSRLRFIRGNHDCPSVCCEYPNYMGGYGVDPETGIFFLGGGFSIDWHRRAAGIDWWEDEELSYGELYKAMDLYEKVKPTVVVSHEAPASINPTVGTTEFVHSPSRTSNLLQSMLEIHKPDLWVFGHHHKVWRKKINGTLFCCAAINQVVTFEIEPPTKEK